MKLTEHFSLEEFTRTSYKDHLKGNQEYGDKFHKRLRITACTLEELRSVLDVSITITSGIRSPELNKAVGGSRTSTHMDALSADITFKGMTIKEGFDIIVERQDECPSLRKVIYENINSREWLHVQSKELMQEPKEFYATVDGKKYNRVKG